MLGKTFLLQNLINPEGAQALQLNCLNNKFISIFSALHGIYFDFPTNARPNCPDVCFYKNYFEDTKSSCES